MPKWQNAAGHALSSSAWLEVHHLAKLSERARFAQSLAQYKPQRLVDLGCGTGLWLDLLDSALPSECEFIGIDSDSESLDLARDRGRSWSRQSNFLLGDIGDHTQIPQSDLILAFNLFPYLPNISQLLKSLQCSRKIERVVLRQYDGGTMRIGPMSPEDRHEIDLSLYTSLRESTEPSHYAMDQAYEIARLSGLTIEKLDFEITQRHAPFTGEFVDYLQGTVDWMEDLLPEDAAARLRTVLEGNTSAKSAYFMQVDLVVILLTGP